MSAHADGGGPADEELVRRAAAVAVVLLDRSGREGRCPRRGCGP
ncbi:hypothetical protein [Streptomyces sp. NPDC047869]